MSVFKCKDLHVSANVRIDGIKYINLGSNIYLSRGGWFHAIDSYGSQTFSPKLTIGNGVKISENVHIGCVCNINIGNDVLIGSKALIIDHHHGTYHDLATAPAERNLDYNPIVIHDKVFIGENVVIFPGVVIGESAVIGANSVVTKSIPAYSIALGSPARVIKYLGNS